MTPQAGKPNNVLLGWHTAGRLVTQLLLKFAAAQQCSVERQTCVNAQHLMHIEI